MNSGQDLQRNSLDHISLEVLKQTEVVKMLTNRWSSFVNSAAWGSSDLVA